MSRKRRHDDPEGAPAPTEAPAIVPRPAGRVLAVDFDGVLHSYESGWEGVAVVSDAPVPGALEWLYACHKAGWDVQIFSSRSSSPDGRLAMAEWLRFHARVNLGNDHPLAGDYLDPGYPVGFPAEKPPAFLSIDDRCIQFLGRFDALDPELLKTFRPWNKLGVSGKG